MSEEQNTAAQELAILKERADLLGIPYNGNIGAETLRARIAEHKAKKDEELVKQSEPQVARTLTRAEQDQEIRNKLKEECLYLVRCRISNLNPAKNDLDGELITVANKYIGTHAKFIPFGEAGESYHIPKLIYDELVQRRFQSVTTKKDASGREQVIRRLVPEYSIEILPPLTAEALEELAIKQAAAARLGA